MIFGFEVAPCPPRTLFVMNLPTNTVWMRLRTPALFGAGLYLGLIIFGREKQESAFFVGLRGMMFEGNGRSGGRVDTDDDIGGKS